MGRVYKTQRHKITQSDGTDADYLASLTWYDSEGRVIKVKGETITKTAYDRIGRPTHAFTIAYDNDSGYTDADDVSGDYVLEESQTVYQGTTSNNVIWRAVIARRRRRRSARRAGILLPELERRRGRSGLVRRSAAARGAVQRLRRAVGVPRG